MSADYNSWLSDKGLSEHTRDSYLFALRQYTERYGDKFSRKNLNDYKLWLLDNFSPRTVNLRLQGINNYLASNNKDNLKLTFVKVQQKPFLENVISLADYEFLKSSLKKDGDLDGYFMIRFLGATGARVSELVKIKAESVKAGYIDLLSKGGKLRRIYIPKALREEALLWLAETDKTSGYLFTSAHGERITSRGVAGRLARYADKYGIDREVMYPHSFRHLFAKSFLERCNDISFLADLLGHESIETTRIYLRKTATEQRAIVDSVVDW